MRRALRAQLFLLSAALTISLAAVADHQEENVWTSNGDEFTDQNAACGNIEDPPNGTNVEYSVWRADTSNLSGCERDKNVCRNTFNGSLTAIAGCGDDQYEVIQTSIELAGVGFFTRIIEHDDPVDCELLAGNTTQYSFSHYFDGDPPDMSGLSCLNSCSQDVGVSTTTEYSNVTGSYEASVEHYEVTQTANGLECDFSAFPDPPETPDGVAELPEDENCTADFYTSPTTGAIVCGTPPQSTTSDNGTTTTTETDANGNKTTTVETPDGATTTTTNHPDGTSTVTTTDASGNQSNRYEPTNEINNADDDEDCPSNMYVLSGGVLVCGDSPTGDSGDIDLSEVVNAIDEGNATLESIDEKLDWEAPTGTEPTEQSDNTSDIEAAQTAFDDALDSLVTGLSATTELQLADAQYSCNRVVNVLGQTLRFCMPPESLDLLAMMGTVLLFIAHLTAAMIILRF